MKVKQKIVYPHLGIIDEVWEEILDEPNKGETMKITTFKNGKGLIHGPDPKRIGCDKKGVLKIGTSETSITPEAEAVMPLLANGASADYSATFTDAEGYTYDLGKVEVRSGRIAPPSPTAVEIMELRCREESLEAENEALHREIKELRGIFDTNALNFLIK